MITQTSKNPLYTRASQDCRKIRCYNQFATLTDPKIHCSMNLISRTFGESSKLFKTSKSFEIGAIATKIQPIPCGRSGFVVYVSFHNFCSNPLTTFSKTETCQHVCNLCTIDIKHTFTISSMIRNGTKIRNTNFELSNTGHKIILRFPPTLPPE